MQTPASDPALEADHPKLELVPALRIGTSEATAVLASNLAVLQALPYQSLYFGDNADLNLDRTVSVEGC